MTRLANGLLRIALLFLLLSCAACGRLPPRSQPLDETFWRGVFDDIDHDKERAP